MKITFSITFSFYKMLMDWLQFQNISIDNLFAEAG